jgi:ribulose-phosphate 3-epimerase
MIRICPSILNADRSNLASEIAKIAKESDLLHLDVMDNIFVPNKTFDLGESERIIKECPIPVDAHLMIAEPEKTVRKYGEFGARSITFHFEATTNLELCITEIKQSGARVGIALKPATPFSAIAKFMSEIDMVLIMTVEPGFGGQSFMENMMEKVRQARGEIDQNKFKDIWLQVDGGISLETISTAFEAGADTFVAGSAVFKDPNPGLMVDKLRAKIS